MVTEHVRGRTRWRRFALIFLGGLLAVVLLFVGLVQGALAASFTIAGVPFHGTVGRLTSEGAVLFGDVDQSSRAAVPVVDIGFGQARIDDLCLSFAITGLPVIGTAGVEITADDVAAQNLLLGLEGAAGKSLLLNNVEIGRDAGTLDKGPKGPPGAFGLQSDAFALDQVQLTGRSGSAGTLQLNDFSIGITRDRPGCGAPAGSRSHGEAPGSTPGTPDGGPGSGGPNPPTTKGN